MMLHKLTLICAFPTKKCSVKPEQVAQIFRDLPYHFHLNTIFTRLYPTFYNLLYHKYIDIT